MVRLFVAIDIPDSIREQFREIQEVLRQSRARLNLVDFESMHITLKFIGEVTGSSLSQINEALSGIEISPFSLDVGIIATNNPKTPRVIWAEVQDPGSCRNLAGLIDAALTPFGIEPEKRRFRPHITIARVKQFHQSLFEPLAEVATLCNGTIPVDRIILKKSELTPDGPIYTDILNLPLKVQA